jgi:hypothetical protein
LSSVGMGHRPAEFHEKPRDGQAKPPPPPGPGAGSLWGRRFRLPTAGIRRFFDPVNSAALPVPRRPQGGTGHRFSWPVKSGNQSQRGKPIVCGAESFPGTPGR